MVSWVRVLAGAACVVLLVSSADAQEVPAPADAGPEDRGAEAAAPPGEPGGTPGEPGGTPGEPEGTPGEPEGTPGEPEGTPGQPSPEGAVEAAAVVHGSRQGNGDSRGPGAGNGRGRALRVPGEEAPRPPSEIDVEPAKVDPFLFRLGDFTLRPQLEYRVRYYHREGGDFDAGGVSNFFRHRARVGLEGYYDDWVGVHVTLQDVRTWGEELDPRFEVAQRFDVAQSYLELRPVDHLSVRMGRQILHVGDGQVIGRAPFSEGERRFDAVRLAYQRNGSIFELAYAYVGLVPSPDGDGPSSAQDERHFGFLHVANQSNKAIRGRAIAAAEVDSGVDDRVDDGLLLRGTLSAQLEGSSSGPVEIGYLAHGYYQISSLAAGASDTFDAQRDDGFFSAFMGRARLSATAVDTLFNPSITAHAAVVSGDSGNTVRTFVRPFPNAHWPHGQMDLIFNYVRDTARRGLRDFGGSVGWKPLDIATKATFYVFDTLFENPASPPGEPASTHIGWELDFSASYPLHEYVKLNGVYAFFVPGDASPLPLATGSAVEHFAYLTAHAKF